MSEEVGLKYGWHSKRIIMPNKPPRPRKIPDRSAKQQKKRLQRMTYAPEGDVYAIDIMFIRASHPVANTPGSHHFPPVAQYLLVQNINTRYLRSFTIPDKTKDTILKALNDLLFQLIQ
jgi:hypothetical protein